MSAIHALYVSCWSAVLNMPQNMLILSFWKFSVANSESVAGSCGKKNEVADYEATTFSIFYNNTLFLLIVIIASFFLLKNFNPTV